MVVVVVLVAPMARLLLLVSFSSSIAFSERAVLAVSSGAFVLPGVRLGVRDRQC